jgi:cysteamine dioxygenase
MLKLKSQIRHRPTALYSEVFGNSQFLVCVFILYPNARIPLHSHPGMYGILKVVQGEILIRNYTPLTKIDFSKTKISSFEAYETCASMDKNSQPSVVTPENNLHEIINSRNEAAVFLDILR